MMKLDATNLITLFPKTLLHNGLTKIPTTCPQHPNTTLATIVVVNPVETIVAAAGGLMAVERAVMAMVNLPLNKFLGNAKDGFPLTRGPPRLARI